MGSFVMKLCPKCFTENLDDIGYELDKKTLKFIKTYCKCGWENIRE